MKALSWTVVMMVSLWGSAATRAPAVAGAFYPGDEARLRAAVDEMLSAAGRGAGGDSTVAVVVPHAGYVYSGATAARAFAPLAGREVDRVILLGPSHRASFSGGALPDRRTTAWATPLGEVALDAEALDGLRSSKLFAGPSAAHEGEHCLEVEVPFLQVVAPAARLVPILVGQGTDRGMAAAMARELAALLGPRTVVVTSTDFSHHGMAYGWAPFADDRHLGNTLVELGRVTADRVAKVDPRGFWQQVEVSGDTVCGKRPVAVLAELLDHAFAGRGEVAGVTTSGQVSGSWDQSVTYAAVRFDGSWTGWRERPPAARLGELTGADKVAVLELARAALASHLEHDGSLARWFSRHPVQGQLESLAGAFVTLQNTGLKAREHGRLRACMGVIEAREPLVDAVISSAVSAAHDPRFPRLEASELDDLHLEVSVLSPTWVASGFDEIEVGTHGVVLSKSGRAAVFLPQVAPEQGWDRDTMLRHLAMKAGLPGDAWKQGATFELFTAQVFAEEE